MQKPFLKWVGGKSQIIESVMERFPKSMDNYHEIFLGGGSVLFALLSSDIEIRGSVNAYDYNYTLICTYRNLQKKPRSFYNAINVLIEKYNSYPAEIATSQNKPKSMDDVNCQESYYYYVRSKYNSMEDKSTPECSAMFVFLNKLCFRGLYREGPNGFNVPFGHYKSPTIITAKDISQVHKLIQKVNFIHANCTDSLLLPKAGDFVYLDPPYADEKSFVHYTKDGFDKQMHEKLFNLTKALPTKFLMSNSYSPIVTTAFSAYTINKITARRSINSKSPGSTTTEVLISN
jgi:DNA adenine methylase